MRGAAERGLFFQGTGVMIALDPDGPLFGLLLTGPAGSGKSGLALDLIGACPWQRSCLISDDGLRLTRDGDRLIAHSVATTAGLLEIRGGGFVRPPMTPSGRLRLHLELGERSARLPESEASEQAGIRLPVVKLDTIQLCTAQKIRYIARSFAAGLSLDRPETGNAADPAAKDQK